jgi:hypothetical protein
MKYMISYKLEEKETYTHFLEVSKHHHGNENI